MKFPKIIRSLFFLLIGLALFWFVYKSIDYKTLGKALSGLNFWWIGLSIFIGLFSHILRALRWQMLISSMGHESRLKNLYLSILVLYFTNLIIPRGGEVARCGVINKYDSIPFTKLLGTVVTERLADFISFLLIVMMVALWRMSYFSELLTLPEIAFDSSEITSKLLHYGIILLVIVIVVYGIFKMGFFKKLTNKIMKYKNDFLEGIKSISKMEGRGRFIVYTFSIFILWLVMFYMIFLAYKPTSHLSFTVAIFIFSIATMSYLLPIQAGIGAWHFIVIQSLLLFNISPEHGMIFALVAHTSISLIYLVIGGIAFILLPVVNGRRG